MREIAIDATVVVALLNPADLWNAQAHALSGTITDRDIKAVFFDCVLAEAISAVARRLHEKRRGSEVTAALHTLENLVTPDQIAWILPDVPRLYVDVLNLMGSSSGELNFNDALIALACREREIGLIASFDPDFDRLPWLKRVATPSDIPST